MANLGFTFDPSVTRALSNYELAISLFEHGLHVFPCQHKGGGAKQPCPGVMWRRKSSRQMIDQQWQRWPDAMPGLNLGESGLLVVDADGAAGIAAWEAIAAEHGGCDAPTVDTPGNGRHYYFRQPEGLNHGNARGNLPPKDVCPVDIRGAGGYIIAPGAEREDGVYEPGDGDPLAILDAPIMPPWLVDLLTKAPPQEQPKPSTHIAPSIDVEHPRLKAYVEQTYNDEIRALATCGAGGRNNQLNTSGFSLFQLAAAKWSGVSASEVEAALFQAAEECGLVADDGAASVRKTIRSARRGGMASPRPLPEHIASEIDEEGRALEYGRQCAAAIVRQDDGTLIDQDTGEIIEDEERPIELLDGIKLGEGVDWQKPGGLIEEIANWIMATSRWPNKPLAIAGALATVAAPCMRHLYSPSGASLNPYLIMLAGTGIGKGSPLAAPPKILKAADMDSLHTVMKVFSVSGLEEMIVDHPGCIATTDEIGPNLLRKMFHRRASSHEIGLKTPLMELWSREIGREDWYPTKRAQGTQTPVPSPGLSILGASTHEEFFEAVGGNSITDGFLNRFLIVQAAPRGELNDNVPPEVRKVPANIVRRMKLLMPDGDGNLAGGLNTYTLYGSVTETSVPWASDDVRLAMRAFTIEMADRLDSDPQYGGCVARAAEYTERLATLHAVSRDGLRAKVKMEDLEWGAAFVLASARAVIEGAQDIMAKNDHEEKVNSIRKTIRKAKEISERDLLRRLPHITSRDRESIIRDMETSGMVYKWNKNGGGKGRPSWMLRWIG